MTAVPARSSARPYWKIGRENYHQGAAAKQQKEQYSQYREYRQGDLEYHLTKFDMGRSAKPFTPEELRQMWRLRYEVKNTWTYDQLAKKFGRRDTWDIVNALTEMKRRKAAGIDQFAPFRCGDRVIVKKSLANNHTGRKISEQTKEIIRFYGAGMKPRQIGELYDKTNSEIRNTIYRTRKRHPDLYNMLLEEGMEQNGTNKK